MSCGAWKDEASASKRASRAYNFEGFGNVMQEKFVKFFTSCAGETPNPPGTTVQLHISRGGGGRFFSRSINRKHVLTNPVPPITVRPAAIRELSQNRGLPAFLLGSRPS